MQIQDIDFDDEEFVKQHQHDIVEIELGPLYFLLSLFYMGGGEPDSKNRRLQLALNSYQDYL
jgi:hypothetical protein